MVLEPEHFTCLFLIMGFIISLGLIVLLWDILANPSFGFYGLMISGLFVCLLITFGNLFFFSPVLLKHMTRETEKRNYTDLLYGTGYKEDAKTIRTGDFEFDMEILVNNKAVVFAFFGYAAVTSFIFIFLGMMKSLGKTHFLIEINILRFIYSGIYYYNSIQETTADTKDTGDE